MALIVNINFYLIEYREINKNFDFRKEVRYLHNGYWKFR